MSADSWGYCQAVACLPEIGPVRVVRVHLWAPDGIWGRTFMLCDRCSTGWVTERQIEVRLPRWEAEPLRVVR